MAGLTDSLSSLISSILSAIRSIFETLFHGVASVTALIQNSVMSVVDLAGGLVNFVFGKSRSSSDNVRRGGLMMTVQDIL